VKNKNPYVALILGWLIPGAGHLKKKKKAKALAFLLSLSITFFIGLILGDYRNVYFDLVNSKLTTFGQLPMGLIAILTMLKTRISGPAIELMPDYSIGTSFTCIAGLLNVLVMCSAFRDAKKTLAPHEKSSPRAQK